jgi:hypothetical protein
MEAVHASRLAALTETRELVTGASDSSAGPVRLLDVPDVTYLGTRRRVGLPELAGLIETTVAEHTGRAAGAPFVIVHIPVLEDATGDVEVCVPVSRHEGAGTLPRHRALSVEATGRAARFPDILRSYERLAVTAHVRGLRLSGPPREVYLGRSTQIVWPVDDA